MSCESSVAAGRILVGRDARRAGRVGVMLLRRESDLRCVVCVVCVEKRTALVATRIQREHSIFA